MDVADSIVDMKQDLCFVQTAKVDSATVLLQNHQFNPSANPIPLRGMVDTGSGVSNMNFSALNRVAMQTGVALQPHRINFYAANGKK